ncbi:hypothetical protein BN2476_70047 [Paraburkholderia piptadeniae]|uniref:Uncharacterized protein n=1 Tax=Paraburkholderia piptadeniae TaxID=1701573 RepID=A0A1N7RLG5_9BURK|nr:hypothetical protein BN2476_70047 [Paraburkholderia piptadeniae]
MTSPTGRLAMNVTPKSESFTDQCVSFYKLYL